jgi:diaminohydroxyphosphoribosylaminopyrimidine deaminase/5-amino-6-(5-phosphoribosylamino)uracil reductase
VTDNCLIVQYENTMVIDDRDRQYMARALELAARGQGYVEPNPMVGCIIVAQDRIVGEGFHTAFGRPHAEIEALGAAKDAANGATMFVTLEPCCHHGKTPPCTRAIRDANITRVVVATRDPFAEVDGGGLAELRETGIDVQDGVLEEEARALNAAYFKRLETGRPWVIAKWAMSLDGKIATGTGDSRWISSEASRKLVHQLRGRMDAIMVGRATAVADDPLLTARPAGPRQAVRIVVDSLGSLSLDSQLVATARTIPVLVAAGGEAADDAVQLLRDRGCEVLICDGDHPNDRLLWLLDELGRREMTNILVEGGSLLLGSLFDAGAVDEVLAFVAPRIVGGNGPSAVAGAGFERISEAWRIDVDEIRTIGEDTCIRGRVRRGAVGPPTDLSQLA